MPFCLPHIPYVPGMGRLHKGENNKGIFPKGARETKAKNRYKPNLHGHGDGPWENQGLFTPI